MGSESRKSSYQFDLFGSGSHPDRESDLDVWYRKKGFPNIAGVDEAGRGALAGPVSAAAVILGSDSIDGLDDSKKLTPDVRAELYKEIWSKADGVGVALVGPGMIDDINILQASLYAMKLAVAMLPRIPGIVLVDGNQVPAGLDNAVSVIKGDTKSGSIMAASIIAKVTRDRYMARLAVQYPEYQFDQHKGYAVPAHYSALEAYGPSEIHRMSFAPCRDAKRKLPDHDDEVTIALRVSGGKVT